MSYLFTNALAEELKLLVATPRFMQALPRAGKYRVQRCCNVKFSPKGISARECVSYCIDEADKGKIIIVPNMMVKVAAIASKFNKRDSTRHSGTQSKSKIQHKLVRPLN